MSKKPEHEQRINVWVAASILIMVSAIGLLIVQVNTALGNRMSHFSAFMIGSGGMSMVIVWQFARECIGKPKSRQQYGRR